jgi:hypothetical protein
MYSRRIIVFFKKALFIFLLAILSLLSKNTLAQAVTDTPITNFISYNKPVIYKPFPITGRIVGMNLEILKAALVVNLCTAETTRANDNGIYHISAGKGDTLAFAYGRYSATLLGIKSPKDKFNVVLMKRKAGNLPPGHSGSDYEKAKKEDDELYKILDKDAKLEGKWNY